MPLGEAIELYRYRTNSLRDGVATWSRAWNVEGLGPDVAVQVPAIPNYRDPHPSDSNMIVRSINATPRGAGSLIEVSYAPAPYVGGSGPGINEFSEGFIGTDVSFDNEDVELPLFRVVDMVFGEGDSAVEKTVFEAIPDVVPFRRPVPYYRVTVALTLTDPATFTDALALGDVIAAQVGNIHTIGGRDLVFSCEGIDQNDVNEYKIAYRWTQDKGVANTLANDFGPSAGPNLRYLESTVYPVFNDDFLIPPYKGLRIDGNVDPEQAPTVTFFDRFKREPNGWQNLPGIA